MDLRREDTGIALQDLTIPRMTQRSLDNLHQACQQANDAVQSSMSHLRKIQRQEEESGVSLPVHVSRDYMTARNEYQVRRNESVVTNPS